MERVTYQRDAWAKCVIPLTTSFFKVKATQSKFPLDWTCMAPCSIRPASPVNRHCNTGCILLHQVTGVRREPYGSPQASWAGTAAG